MADGDRRGAVGEERGDLLHLTVPEASPFGRGGGRGGRRGRGRGRGAVRDRRRELKRGMNCGELVECCTVPSAPQVAPGLVYGIRLGTPASAAAEPASGLTCLLLARLGAAL